MLMSCQRGKEACDNSGSSDEDGEVCKCISSHYILTGKGNLLADGRKTHSVCVTVAVAAHCFHPAVKSFYAESFKNL